MRARAMLLLGLLSGCSELPQVGEATSCEAEGQIKPDYVDQVDLVLVIADSPAMTDLQARLIENLHRFGLLFESEGIPSLNIAVVRGSGGGFTSEPRLEGCSPPDGAFVIDHSDRWWTCPEDRCSVRNYEGTLGDALACIGALGGDGPAGQPIFDVLRAALDPADPTAAAFHRPTAYLVVVVVSAEDDASTTSAAELAAYLRGLRTGPVVVVATITGDASPRLQALADEFPQRSDSVAIGEPDWSTWLGLVFNLGARTLDLACEPSGVPYDLNPDEPGRQLECVASIMDGDVEVLVPACRMQSDSRPHPYTPRPCYWLQPIDYAPGCAAHAVLEYESPDHRYGRLRCAVDCSLL